ncbi:hypothetical protein AB835_05380 [Candidatus Endobugula sertula]|uniref:Uncharacterized protein n=1 Tax=Candidatus Endobugula sertula TaxID=62101 RepID=A0A1D2QR54_9GAMM|nr:hypothetical protein AB835_05380 [Candidatus Endobugula sertula]
MPKNHSLQVYAIEAGQIHDLSVSIYSYQDILIDGISFLENKAIVLFSNAMMISLLFSALAFWLSYRVVRPSLVAVKDGRDI